MKKMRTFKYLPILMVILALGVSSCVQAPSGGRKRGSSEDSSKNSDDKGNGAKNANGGDGAAQENGSIESNNSITTGRAEIRHLVDPFDGTYKSKVTVPKNFTGLLYLAGLNITSLTDRLVYVRFNFGRGMEPIDIPAVISRAPGIIPQTDIEVLVLDMQDRPFEKIRLLYDLYDYNDYRNSGVESKEPVSDSLNGKLYCRGLKLEHDPTFLSSSTNSRCDARGERCLYAYAKVLDSGLTDPSGNAIAPVQPQIDYSETGYVNSSASDLLLKCLPDNLSVPNPGSLGAILNTNISSLAYDTVISLSGQNHIYRGPYRLSGFSEWEIYGDALFSNVNGGDEPYGIFQKHFRTSFPPAPFDTFRAMAEAGMRSFLFPRAGKMDLKAGVEHFGSVGPFDDSRILQSLVAAGSSRYMNGCNMRTSLYDTSTGDSIASCNVTATIELLAKDPSTGALTLINGTTNKDLKLQLVRASSKNSQGKEVLYSALKTCNNSQACGADECCFNTRCWSRDLVSQCLEDSNTVGNLATGQSCKSDYECSSLCCNQTTGNCGVHINTKNEKSLCSKAPGQTCVSKEWCREESVTIYKIIKDGLDQQGQQRCILFQGSEQRLGDCVSGLCVPPQAETKPVFDPENPDCSAAVDL